ncbi:MAG: MFS transporter [Clostridia bacterium]|nr:MFS transporter [Clostridia bacterium]
MNKTARLKYACYSANVTMSAVGNLSPVLFLTFRSLYGISYSLLGLLVLINFVTQLIVDLIFSFFSHKFNIPKTVKAIPLIAGFGFLVYALWPFFVPDGVYIGLVIGTVIFSSASGLGEVLISPVIAAIPSEDPDREMSKLHSVYAWGVVFVIAVSTVFLLLAGNENWQWLALLFTLIPTVSAFLFFGSEMPAMETPKQTSGALKLLRNKGVWLSVFAIFLGGAAECTMAQWCSGYLEQALGIPKLRGDLCGVALFSVMLGLGRSLYAKIGKNIGKVLTWGAVGATLCYLIAAVSPIPTIGLFACAFTGFCVSMLWPGNLIVASDRFPEGGVFIYAMMASGGDLGASVAPQLLGIITDAVIANPNAAALAANLNLSPEQLGMKMGMLCGMLFPLIGIFVYRRIQKNKKKETVK